ncbi:MAG: hypothetical protein IKN85_08905 [Oscillospiraceae bacterium]|nr:hypothetical protein [Oscillospiraceae bacterium]MBR3535934.1 hypothetical protein [Oscillospiraceae bacterium]MBR6837639.1 hypothetical protein [Oscillospiraceae bacterium]
MYKVKKVTKSEYEDFLALPVKIYEKKDLMQKRSDEEQLLKGTHILSRYFSFTAFVCYRDEKPVSRCAVTIYKDSKEAYIGFFDSENDSEAVKILMEEAESFIRSNGISSVTGPVDASFWIGYRMKSDSFNDHRYFSEPYGVSYYPELWKENGYEVSGTYISNIYKKVDNSEADEEKYKKRYEFFRKKGYRIVSAEKKKWDVIIGEVYHLLIELYSDFPVFSYITEDEFRELYKDLKTVLDFSMVKLAYKNDKLVGFLICVPDYGNRLYGNIGFSDILFLLKNRIRCNNYVLLYMGIDGRHLGLGSAISQVIFKELCRKKAASVGALIRKGKVTEKYIDSKVLGKREYVLFNKKL